MGVLKLVGPFSWWKQSIDNFYEIFLHKYTLFFGRVGYVFGLITDVIGFHLVMDLNRGLVLN